MELMANACILTPTDDGGNDKVSHRGLCGYDQLQEHEQGLSSHPHHGDQSEVVDEGRDGHTERKILHSLNATHECQEHESHRETELDAEHCRVTLSQITAEREEPSIHYMHTLQVHM